MVAGGAGDNAAAACGIGAIRPGEGFVSLGTSGVLFVSNDRFRPNTDGRRARLLPRHPRHLAPDGRDPLAPPTASTGWRTITGKTQAELSGAAEAQFKGPGEEIFLPYLSGERTPHNNADARGSFVGLSPSPDPARLAQAVMEGVDLRLPRLPARAATMPAPRSTGCSPSAAARKSALWLKLIATNLDTEIALPEDGDFGGALGAARLGLCAAEGADPAEVMTMPGIKTDHRARRVAAAGLFRPIRALSRALSRHRGGPSSDRFLQGH